MGTSTLVLLALWAADGPDSRENETQGKSELARAMYERRSGRLDEALRRLDAAEPLLKTGRFLAEVHFQRGRIRAALGDLAGAVRSFARALNVDPARLDANDPPDLQGGAREALDCAKGLFKAGKTSHAWTAPPSDPWRCPSTEPSLFDLPAAGETLEASSGTMTASVAALAFPLAPTSPSSTPPTDDGVPPWGTFILGTVSLASAGAGVALGTLAASQATDDDASSNGQSMALGANVTFAIAGTAAAAAVLWWVLE